MNVKELSKEYKLVVIGGGMPGICAAVQAARLGIDTALINDRGYLGGNASAEINVRIQGATDAAGCDYAFFGREGGIIEEILLEDLYRNPTDNRYIMDALLRDITDQEEQLDVYLETTVDEVEMSESGQIRSVSGTQDDSETRFQFYADFFLDDTGDGTVGKLAGADFRMGREASDEFDEHLAPEEADEYVLPSTLFWLAKDVGEPVEYKPPDFAIDLEETDALDNRTIPDDRFGIQWWYELGGDRHQIDETREIIKEHQSLVYGIWDHIKNSGNYDAETYDLEYVSCIPGKRESRRLIGDYILTESDVVDQTQFEDVVGHGGWSIDHHAAKGFFSDKKINKHVLLNGIYQIPYRTGYSRNVENLFMAGRCMSTTHIALGSTRVMATLSTLGQALGVAAYLCIEHQTLPRGVYEDHCEELQQLLLRENQYVVGASNTDPADKAPQASVEVSSVASCELTTRTGEHSLTEPAVLLLPCVDSVDELSLLVQNDEPATVVYTVSVQSEKFSYYPSERLARGELELDVHENFEWIDLELDVDTDTNALFVELESDDEVTLGTSDRRLPGVVSAHKRPNTSERIVDVNTLEPRDYRVDQLDQSFCFKTSPTQPVYEGANVLNGYNRPHGLPHVWVSEPIEESEWIEFIFDDSQSVDELRLYFDSEYGRSVFYHRDNDRCAPPSLVKDYTVFYRNDADNWERIERIEDNHQRLNRITTNTIETDALRIEFDATNGIPTVNLFEARIY